MACPCRQDPQPGVIQSPVSAPKSHSKREHEVPKTKPKRRSKAPKQNELYQAVIKQHASVEEKKPHKVSREPVSNKSFVGGGSGCGGCGVCPSCCVQGPPGQPGPTGPQGSSLFTASTQFVPQPITDEPVDVDNSDTVFTLPDSPATANVYDSVTLTYSAVNGNDGPVTVQFTIALMLLMDNVQFGQTFYDTRQVTLATASTPGSTQLFSFTVSAARLAATSGTHDFSAQVSYTFLNTPGVTLSVQSITTGLLAYQ